jgi:hypothetical protein
LILDFSLVTAKMRLHQEHQALHNRLEVAIGA